MLICFKTVRFAAWQRFFSRAKNAVIYSNEGGSDPHTENGPGWYSGGSRGFMQVASGSECPESVEMMIRDMHLQHAVADMFIEHKDTDPARYPRLPIEVCLFSCSVPPMVESRDPSQNAGLTWALQDGFFSGLPRQKRYIHGGESLFPIDTYLLDEQGEKRYREIVKAEGDAVFATGTRYPTRSALRISACFDGTWLCVRSLPYRNPFNSLHDIEAFCQEQVHMIATDNYSLINRVAHCRLESTDKKAKLRLWGGE